MSDACVPDARLVRAVCVGRGDDPSDPDDWANAEADVRTMLHAAASEGANAISVDDGALWIADRLSVIEPHGHENRETR